MRAIQISPDGALHVAEVADPQPGPDELLVRVHAAGINRADLLQRSGRYPPPPGASPILGLELAGEVLVGAGDWQPGDPVMAVVTGGGYAELATVPIGMAMPIPHLMNYNEAAAIPEAFLTGYLNLFTLGHLAADETVLIHAGASGVGTAAIQLAREAGARVLATTGSADKVVYCQDLGAEAAFNYKADPWPQRVLEITDERGVNLILDFVGALYWDANLSVLARGGRLQLIGFLGSATGHLNIGPILSKSLTVRGTTLRGTPLAEKTMLTQEFVAFAESRFADGSLQPVIDSVFPLEEAEAAHARMESNKNIGKIILSLEQTFDSAVE